MLPCSAWKSHVGLTHHTTSCSSVSGDCCDDVSFAFVTRLPCCKRLFTWSRPPCKHALGHATLLPLLPLLLMMLLIPVWQSCFCYEADDLPPPQAVQWSGCAHLGTGHCIRSGTLARTGPYDHTQVREHTGVRLLCVDQQGHCTPGCAVSSLQHLLCVADYVSW